MILANLKLELMRRKMTQGQLAEQIGVSESQLSRIIRGDVRCGPRMRRLIADYLQLPIKGIFPALRSCRRALKRKKKQANSSHEAGKETRATTRR